MPIDRYQIRNVYSLGDPDLYKAADKDDPEALLEGVAMAGLVGVVRQLGDLADFAAEIFHELHEEVTATAARGHGLLVRAQQLELELPSMERSFMSQTCHSTFFPNSGIDWNPNRKTTQNLITMGDLPRFVMNSYEECRGPPRLFLLDKFDVGGVGACLKRYTDPSFFKVEVSSHEIENAENQRDKKIRKNKKKGSQWKGGVTPEVSPNSKAKLHRLFLEDRLQNVTIESTHRVKLKKRPNKSPFDSESRESYMNKLLSSQSEGKIVHPVPFHPSILIPVPSDSPNQSNREKFMDTISSPFSLSRHSTSPSVSSSGGRRNPADNLAGKVTDRQTFDLTTSTSSDADEKKIVVDEEIGIFGVQNGYRSDDVASEMDNYVDALATMESEVETDGESKTKIDPIINQETNSDQFSDSQLTEIPFRPRVPLEKIPAISSGANQGVVLEEGSENEEDANVKNEDFVSPAGSLLSFQFFGNYEGEVENEHRNDGCSPINHVPNILEANKDNHSTTLLESRCSSPHSVISCADEPSFGVSLTEHDSVVEETLGSCEICSLPEEQLKKIEDGDDVLRDFDSPEVKVDGMESNNSGIGIVTRAVSDLDDADKSDELNERDTGLVSSEVEVGSTPVYVPDDVDKKDDNALSTHEDDTELEGKGEEEEDSVDSEKLEKNVSGLLPLDADKIEDTTHSTVEEPKSCIIPDSAPYDDNSRKPILDDDDDDDDDGDVDDGDDNPSLLQDQTHSFLEENNQTVQQAAVLHGDDSDIASGTHVDDQMDFTTHSEPYSVNPASKSEEDLQGKPVTVSVPVPDKPPTLESLQTNGHDIDQVNRQFHSDPCSVKLSTQSEEDPQRKPMTVSVSESEGVTSHGIDLVDQVKHQFHSDPNSINLDSQSEEDPQGKPMTVSVSESESVKSIPQAPSHETNLVDQVNHQFHSDPYSVKLSSQSEEDPHEKPITVSVAENRPTLQATSQNTNLVDQVKHQFHSDPFSVKPSNQSEEDPQGKPITVSASAKLPTLQATSHDTNSIDQVKHQFYSDLFSVKLSSQSEEDPHEKPITVSVSENRPTLQATSHDTNLVDQVNHQFHSDPYSINLAMQNQLPENPSTLEFPQPINHDIDLSDQVKHQSPPVFPGFSILPDIPLVKPKDTPTPTTPTPPLPPLPPMQWRMKRLQSPSLSPTDTDQHNFPPIFQSKHDETKNPETEIDKSEAKFAEDLVKQQTESGQQVFWPSSNAYLIPQGEEMPNNIRPMKSQRPRSPLIDAVATHDKTKLRKVSDRAITKGQENDKLLEQIRTKSYNLKPAVQTRPNLHGPTTNVRLAAILEKANAIRQAFAGSDDDDDSDSWSDS